MKLAITGAPGSGKTQTAKSIARRLTKVGENVKVIDGYVERLQLETGLAYGHFASYPLNFQILFNRLMLEQKYQNEGFSTITCGSIYETTLYCALHGNRSWVGSPEDTRAHIEGKITMEAISMFETMTSDYLHIFRLPYDSKRLAEKEDGWDTVIDQKLPEVLEGYFRYATVLEGTLKERTDFAINIINAIQTQTPEDEQQSV
jgi:hypothetical protein